MPARKLEKYLARQFEQNILGDCLEREQKYRVANFEMLRRHGRNLAMQLGAMDYVTKPFTVEYLEETVDAKIAQHLVCA